MRIQRENKSAELQTKFPAIQAALACLNNNGVQSSNDRIYISVARMDQALLASVPLLCTGKGASLIDPDLPGLVGWQHEVFFAADANHRLIGQIGVLERDARRDSRPVKHLVLEFRKDLNYLVRVTVTGWCQALSERSADDTLLGELNHRDIAVTVYREPEEGLDQLLSRVWTDANLCMHFGPAGLSTENPDVMYFLSCLTRMVIDFEEKTFFRGFFDGLPVNSFSAEDRAAGQGMLGDVAFDCSNWKDTVRNVRLYLTRGNAKISFFYKEKTDFLGNDSGLEIAGMHGTLQEVRQLLDEANRGWAQSRQSALAIS